MSDIKLPQKLQKITDDLLREYTWSPVAELASWTPHTGREEKRKGNCHTCLSALTKHTPSYSSSIWDLKYCRISFLLAFIVGVSRPFSIENSSVWMQMAFT
ncbi:hypothetical protein FQN60_010499 [Etheostoma spectabile]|uniref:Uncharacterized protein n=1 Tax=Etheostoma spectabile TaxID=54343 RepID=A0A5J5D701_9PERO|nr:hypothetical protein FQN60_010499 [Etheostoma spectabile]